jgi:hypothetical protein
MNGSRVYFDDNLTEEQEAFIRKWIKTLRSRKYKQGTGFLVLHTNSQLRHCCLGVACDISDVYTSVYTSDHIGNHVFFTLPNGEQRNGYLYEGYTFGLRTTSGDPRDGLSSRMFFPITFMNDHGVSFRKISKILEKDLNRELDFDTYYTIIGEKLYAKLEVS